MTSRRRYVAGGLLLGVGLGGFVDGIVFHQLLQWHHLLTSAADESLSWHTTWDGVFHALTWVATLGGALLVVRSWERPPLRKTLGLLLAGWGGFNVVDSVLSHWLLGLHHIREDVANPLPWDLGFFAISLVLVASGWVLSLQSAHGQDPGARHARTGRSLQGGTRLPRR